jgi:hypothetical protein
VAWPGFRTAPPHAWRQGTAVVAISRNLCSKRALGNALISGNLIIFVSDIKGRSYGLEKLIYSFGSLTAHTGAFGSKKATAGCLSAVARLCPPEFAAKSAY